MSKVEIPQSDAISARHKPKGDKRERTRTALLEAARAVIREKGHERTTMEEVATRAGMTTGAIWRRSGRWSGTRSSASPR